VIKGILKPLILEAVWESIVIATALKRCKHAIQMFHVLNSASASSVACDTPSIRTIAFGSQSLNLLEGIYLTLCHLHIQLVPKYLQEQALELLHK
jgi:hypothetical protein